LEQKIPFLCNRKNSVFPFIYLDFRVYLPQHCLNLRPLPHGFGGFWEHLKAFEPIFSPFYAFDSFRDHLGNLAEGI